jgi:hypothetical protein
MTTDTVKLGRYLMQYIFESEWVGEMDMDMISCIFSDLHTHNMEDH